MEILIIKWMLSFIVVTGSLMYILQWEQISDVKITCLNAKKWLNDACRWIKFDSKKWLQNLFEKLTDLFANLILVLLGIVVVIATLILLFFLIWRVWSFVSSPPPTNELIAWIIVGFVISRIF